MAHLITNRRRGGFTLVELLVVIAIIGVLVALLLPAVQAARESARRAQCSNNIKNLAVGCINYETGKKKMPYGRKFDYWDTYTWVQLILPYIEQQAVYNLYWTLPNEKRLTPPVPLANGPIGCIGNDPRLREARHAQIPPFYCPSDAMPIANEMFTQEYGLWRGSYRGCVGGGDMYGNRVDTLEGLLPANSLMGAFAVKSPADRVHDLVPPNRLREIDDGTSNTLFISEGVAATVPHWGGPIGGIVYGNMGGALFSSAYTPNTGEFDKPIGPCPQNQQDAEYTAPCAALGGHPGPANPGAAGAHAAARSKHPGGVNAAMMDGSVRFANESIDTLVWRAMGTKDRGESPSP